MRRRWCGCSPRASSPWRWPCRIGDNAATGRWYRVRDGALAGVRVVDLAQGVAGSYCGKMLACYGADVVKFERRGGSSAVDGGTSRAGWFYLNTGKEVLTVDIADADDRARLARHIALADVLVTDAESRTAFGDVIPFERLTQEHPRMVHADTSPFGTSGPYADFVAEPMTIYGLGGYMYLTGDPGREPLQGPAAQPGYMAGAQAFAGVLLALLARDQNGGQRVEVAEVEALACAHQWTVARYSYSGMVQRRIGNRYDSGHPITILPCKGGYVSIGASNDEQASRFAELTGIPELLSDERFATSISRLVNADAYDAVVQPWLDERTKDEVTEVCQEWRIPCAPVSTLEDLLHHPQLEYRKFWRRLDQPGAGAMIYPGPPFGMSKTPGEIRPVRLADAANANARWGARDEIPVEKRSQGLPLAGIRVVDFTRVWSGPLATRILADFGAEVIRIERPIPSNARRIPAEQAKRSGFYPDNDPGDQPWHRNAFLNLFGRNKRSIAVDLARAPAREVVRELIATCDVVAENFSPRVMANLGFDYARLRPLKDDIIMLSMPGYGMDGPYRDRVAYGTTLEPEVGFSAMMGYTDGGPMRLGVAYPDPVAGIHAAAAVLLALFHRARTGEGQFIELSQMETACSFVGDALIEYQMTGELPRPQGNSHRAYAPYGCFPCAGDDRWVTVAVRSDGEWRALCEIIGRAEFADDRRFATQYSRIAHRAEAYALVATWTRSREMRDVMRQLQAAGIAAGAVSDARDMAEDEHLRARGFYVELEHPDAGRHIYPGQAIRLAATPAAFRSDAPRLGGDTRSVLFDLPGMNADRYKALIDDGAIAEYQPHE